MCVILVWDLLFIVERMVSMSRSIATLASQPLNWRDAHTFRLLFEFHDSC